MLLQTMAIMVASMLLLSSVTLILGSQHMNETAADTPCDALEAEMQAALFKTVHKGLWTACPSQLWLDIYHKLRPSVPSTFIDIGCNKGYTSAELFQRWAPHIKLTKEMIFEMSGDCGTCQDCNRQEGDNEEVQLLHIRESVPGVHTSSHWKIHNVAMTNKSGEVMFTSDCGSELCHIEVAGEGRKVKAYTVDDFVHAEGIHEIAILKMDTEGFDPAVIDGARTTLEQGKADVVTFEYHSVNLWAGTSLKSVVASLEVYGYACYLDGSPTLTRLDAQCWHANYEFREWSNVVCVRKSLKELHVAFERLSFRAAHFMHHTGLYGLPSRAL